MKGSRWLLVIVLVCSASAWGYYISDVTVSPTEPTPSDEVIVTVSGSAPATNYALDHVNSWVLGHVIFVDLHWVSVGIGGAAMTPYNEAVSLGTLGAGSYTVYVRSHYEGRIRARQTLSLDVCGDSSPSTSGSSWSWSWSLDDRPSFSFCRALSICRGSGDCNTSITCTNSAGGISISSAISSTSN